MAKFIVAAVRDQAVKAFNQPMFFRTKDEARRSFGDAVLDPANKSFGQHAADYSMWMLGEWDDSGELTVCSPECLMQAVDVVAST